jgi:hypothetical protein
MLTRRWFWTLIVVVLVIGSMAWQRSRPPTSEWVQPKHPFWIGRTFNAAVRPGMSHAELARHVAAPGDYRTGEWSIPRVSHEVEELVPLGPSVDPAQVEILQWTSDCQEMTIMIHPRYGLVRAQLTTCRSPRKLSDWSTALWKRLTEKPSP